MAAARRTFAKVSPPPSPTSASGARLRALRLAAGYQNTEALAAALGGAISDSNLRNYESSRGVAQSSKARGILARFFGVSIDAFDAYLDGQGTAEALLRAGGRVSAPPPSEVREPTGPILRNHPEWADLCARAVKADPAIEPEDLRAIGLEPFLYGPVGSVDVETVVDLARIRRRLRSGRP